MEGIVDIPKALDIGKTDLGVGFVIPMPQAILGSVYEGRPNFMAIAWLMRCNYKPPLMAVCVNKQHASHAAIAQTRQFSVCFPSEDLIAETDYVGLVSGKRVDKSGLFSLFRGSLEHAPMIRACPLCMECTLVQAVDLPTNTVFIGEIAGAWTEARYLKDGAPDPEAMKPFTLTMPDQRYWALGKQVGKAWHEGKALKKQG